MNKLIWDFKRTTRTIFRRIVKRIHSFTYQVTVDNLKNTLYTELPAPLNWQKVAQGREIMVEIGSGHGEVLLSNNPQESIMIGYEIKSRFFRLTQRKIRKRGDVFVFKGSGYESLFLHYANESISRIYALFPDPWHKKKHAKRRPLTAEFFQNVAQKLKKQGEIVIATDWKDYADFIQHETTKVTNLYNIDIRPYSSEEFGLPVTHYHQKWVRKGRSFTAIVLKKLG